MLTYAIDLLLANLDKDGIALLPDFLSKNQLQRMRAAFECKLRRMRWNDIDGYERTERYRYMVQDILTLDQGFIDAALHPVVKNTLREYLGENYELVEAKGWKSLPTRRDFHGWHGDAWYDRTRVPYIPREVKLGIYLTDVKSGFFEYLKGSHRKEAPRSFRDDEVENLPQSDIVQVSGPAGSAFLFDTSGIHRQSVPVLEPRYAVFCNYHDPSVPLQKEDIDYYRYHPLILNSAFLGNLSEEDRRILGFGNKTNYVHDFVRKSPHSNLHQIYEETFAVKLLANDFRNRIQARLRRIFGCS